MFGRKLISHYGLSLVDNYSSSRLIYNIGLMPTKHKYTPPFKLIVYKNINGPQNNSSGLNSRLLGPQSQRYVSY